MKQKKYSVKAILRKDKISASDNKCPITLLVYIDGKQFKLTTGHKIEAKYWDSIKTRVKSIYPHATELNQTINRQVTSVESYIHRQQSFNEPYDKESIIRFFYGQGDSGHENFIQFFENAIEQYTLTLSKDTIRIYRVTHNKLKQFRTKIGFKDIDEKFIEDFNYFLLNKENNVRNGAFNKHKHLRKIIGKAVKEGLIKKNPYDGIGGRFSEEETHKDYLTVEELGLIEKAQLKGSRGSKINEVRDMFLFSCNTGLRYSDIVSLTPRHVQGGVLKKIMNKTNKTVQLPLNPKALAIVEKYLVHEMPDDKPIFMGISNQKYNTNMKRIGKQTGIQKRITSHTARHTFATILANNANNAYLIKEVLGHSSLKMSLRYIQISLETKKAALLQLTY